MEVIDVILYICILIMSVVVHEVAHGYVADYLGDRTARYAGRLTVNPIPHLDLLGSIILPGLLVLSGAPFLVGWAKPVPFNLSNIRNPRWGASLVAIAGPASNLLLVMIFSFLFWVGGNIGLSPDLLGIFGMVVTVNLVLMLFNLIPIPPLDGHHILFDFLRHPKFNSVKSFMINNRLILLIVVLFFVWPALTPLLYRLVNLFL